MFRLKVDPHRNKVISLAFAHVEMSEDVMILIPPDPNRKHCHGADAASLVASIKCAIAAEAQFDVSSFCYRVLGDTIVIEGTVKERHHAALVTRIAEDIAGKGRVLVRLGGQ